MLSLIFSAIMSVSRARRKIQTWHSAARRVIKMLSKIHTKKPYLFYILILFLWNIATTTSASLEMTDGICDLCGSYVNHSVANLSAIEKTFPIQEYLSAQNTGAQEIVSSARTRSVKPLLRSVRNIMETLFPGMLFAGLSAASMLLMCHEIFPHCSRSIMITNYIHKQDGQKP